MNKHLGLGSGRQAADLDVMGDGGYSEITLWLGITGGVSVATVGQMGPDAKA